MAGIAGSSSSNKRPVKVLTASQFHTSTTLKRQKAAEPAAPACQSNLNLSKQLTVQRFNPLSAPYSTFKTQKEAFDFLDKQPCAALLRTFAQEVSATGKRVFIVTSAEQFWQRYKELPASERHHYEIIREATPCNLYFDLEFCPHTNPALDGPHLVNLLITSTAHQLKEQYDIQFHPSLALELDSSTPTKFSRHLVFRLPGLAFADCCHAGRFARLVMLRILQRGLFSSGYGQLLVRDKEGAGVTSFVDMGVYTRNRAFRLYLSSKFGKDRILRLTNRFGGAKSDPQAVFHDLLVSVQHNSKTCCNKSITPLAGSSDMRHPTSLTDTRGWPNPSLGDGQQSQSLQQFSASPMFRQQAAAAAIQQRQMASLLYCEYNEWQQDLQQLPAAWQQVPMLQLNPLPHKQAVSSRPPCHTSWQQQWQEPGAYRGGDSWPRAAGAGVHHGPAVVCHGASPYPLLEHFITSVCNQGGVQGEIRSWVSMPASASVAFNIKGNRWCGNVERQHKSNGIYYVVDLAGGVYYQKCYDPECRNYRSNCMPLPTAVWQKYRQEQPQQQQVVNGFTLVDISTGVDSHHHPRQQHGTVAEGQELDEDDECLELLQRFETIQHQQQNGKRLLQEQQAESAAHAAVAEDDELCLQLLEQIEQQAGLAA